MKVNEIVRRTLADAALANQRSWPNLEEVAFAARCSTAAAFKATRHLVEIGAVQTHGRGGLTVLDPERVVVTVAVERDLQRDVVVSTTLAGAHEVMEAVDVYALGGTDAAVHFLGDRNTVADNGTRILYVPAEQTQAVMGHVSPGGEVLVVAMDAAAAATWRSGYSSITQTYADLFALPGWQAAEFRRAMWQQLFSTDDWSRKETVADVGISG